MIFLLLPQPAPAHLPGTLLPHGFFLGLGLIYLAALALDRLAGRLRLPAAVAILLLGLALSSHVVARGNPLVGLVQAETIHRVSLALLIFYAGLGINLQRIRGMVASSLRLGTLGGLITLLITGGALVLLRPLLPGGLPLAAVWLTACCLIPTDIGALEDLLAALGARVGGRLTHLLKFEAALSTLTGLLAFGFITGMFQGHGHSAHQALHGAMGETLMQQLGAVAIHLLAGLAAGALVGILAPRLIDTLVRSEQYLLLVSVSLAFVAYGLGQLFGGGGLMAVFAAGVCLANGQATSRFAHHDLARVMHPFNTGAELTVLLLLGLLVQPSALVSVLPLGVLLAFLLLLARLAGVWAVLPGGSFSRRDRLIVAGSGLRSAVPLALALSLVEELPHLRGLTAPAAEALGPRLLALIFVVVLTNLVLQTVLMRRFLASGSLRADA